MCFEITILKKPYSLPLLSADEVTVRKKGRLFVLYPVSFMIRTFFEDRMLREQPK